MSGKGSGRRPARVSDQEWADRWEQTFGVARMPEDRVEKDSESRQPMPMFYMTMGYVPTPEVMPLDFGNEDES